MKFVLFVLGLLTAPVDTAEADDDVYTTVTAKSGAKVAEYRGIRYAQSPE